MWNIVNETESLKEWGATYEDYELYQKCIAILKKQWPDSKIKVSLGTDEKGEYFLIENYDSAMLLKLGKLFGMMKEEDEKEGKS